MLLVLIDYHNPPNRPTDYEGIIGGAILFSLLVVFAWSHWPA